MLPTTTSSVRLSLLVDRKSYLEARMKCTFPWFRRALCRVRAGLCVGRCGLSVVVSVVVSVVAPADECAHEKLFVVGIVVLRCIGCADSRVAPLRARRFRDDRA